MHISSDGVAIYPAPNFLYEMPGRWRSDTAGKRHRPSDVFRHPISSTENDGWVDDTVDGQNPAPPGMVKTLKIMG